MKKLLLSLSAAFLGFAGQADAQVIWSQNFDAATVPSLPATWTQGSTGTPGWKTGTFPLAGWGTATGTTLPAHATNIGVVDDWNDSTTNNLHDTLKSPVFSLVGATSPWFNYDYYFYNATRTATSNTEVAFVIGSTDGGATWMMLDTLDGWAFNEEWHTGHTSLAALGTGPNVRIGITYSDATDHLLGLAVDNLTAINLTAKSAAVTALGYNSITNGISTNGSQLSFLIQNSGVPITSLTCYYTINGGTPVSENFTGLSIASYSSQAFTFTTPMAGAVASSLNNIRVVATTVNSAPNVEPDSFETSSFTLASTSVTRQGLIEEFSSSTCAPCKAFNQNYDPLCITLNANTPGSNFNIIKYQMNWPSPGTDRSYNPDGDTRKSYYGVSGIPEHFVNGVSSNVGWGNPFSAANTTDFTNEAAASHALNSFFDMSVTYTVDTVRKKLGTILNVTPHFTKSDRSYHVYIAVMDKHYQNTTNTTGQLEYYHVMRKMLPSASGHAVTSWTDGVAQQFVDTGVTYTNGNWAAGSSTYPTQGDNKLWSNPFTGSELIAFVEEDGKKSVMQSLLAFPAGSLSISTTSNVDGIKVYPNPATTSANVAFNLREAGNVQVKVMDFTGRVVSEVVNKEMSVGVQSVNIKTAGIAPGNYIVVISTAGGNNADRLTIE